MRRAANKLKRELYRLPAIRAFRGYDYLEALEAHAIRLPPIEPEHLPFLEALRKQGVHIGPAEALGLLGTPAMLAACETLASELRAQPLSGQNAPRLPNRRLMNLPNLYVGA